MTKFCTQCGSGLDPNFKFCGECGAPIASGPAAVSKPSTPISISSVPKSFSTKTQSSSAPETTTGINVKSFVQQNTGTSGKIRKLIPT